MIKFDVKKPSLTVAPWPKMDSLYSYDILHMPATRAARISYLYTNI